MDTNTTVDTPTMLLHGTGYKDRSTFVMCATRGAMRGEMVGALLNLESAGIRMTRAVCIGAEVADAYEQMFDVATKSPFRYALTFEDDMEPPTDALTRLHQGLDAHPELHALSAYYRTKEEPSKPLIIGHAEDVRDRTLRPPTIGVGDDITEVNVIPMGFSLWRLDMFREMKTRPWFRTTRSTQDAYFCTHARLAGYRFGVDCGLRVPHIDGEGRKF